MGVKLNEIMKSSEYKLSQFSQEEIDSLEERLYEKNGKYYAKCLVRDKDILIKPEEVIRQLYIKKLISDYGYPIERMELERPID